MGENPASSFLEVPPQAAGSRLDRFLAEPLGSRAQAQAAIDDGRVRVDGRVRPKRHLVAEGERIEIDPQPAIEGRSDEAPSAPYSVVHSDPWLLVVDKPAGVVVHPARGHASGTLAQALAALGAAGGEDAFRAGIVHRLDRDTSGLLVVAKGDEVHRRLKALLAARELRREYLALVDGHPPARSGTIDAPIGRDRRDRVLVSIDSDQPRAARTHYELVSLLPTSSLLRVVLDTGRTHQIRVHFAAIGHPVCGDPQYGERGQFGLPRQFLHAARLAFVHPMTGEELDVRSPLPADLEAGLRVAGGVEAVNLGYAQEAAGGGAARPKAAPPHCGPSHRR